MANFSDGFISAFHSTVRFGLSKRNVPDQRSICRLVAIGPAWDAGEPNRANLDAVQENVSWRVEPSAGISDKCPLSLIKGDCASLDHRKNLDASSLTTLLRFSFRTWCRFLLARHTVNDALWEFLASRLTVPLLECFVRNLSLHEKLGELAPLSFALERHYAS